VSPADSRHRLIAAQCSAAVVGECGQCHVVSVRRKLNKYQLYNVLHFAFLHAADKNRIESLLAMLYSVLFVLFIVR